MINYQEWIELAKSVTNDVAPNRVFKLKDLFDGIVWDSLDRGDRLELGRQFKCAVMQNLVPHVIYFGKAQNNSAQYIKQEQ